MLTIFNFQGNQVRFVGTADNPEWVAKDVCMCLGLTDTSKALEPLELQDKGTKIVRDIYSHDAWRLAYPQIRLPETTTLVIKNDLSN